MRRIIVDYAKLTHDILSLLVEKFPDGYEDTDIIRFRNLQNELVEAVEVRTEDTIYLVKVSKKLATRIENFEEEEDLDLEVDVITPVKGIDLDEEDEEEDEEEKNALDDDDDDDSSAKRSKIEPDDDDDDDDEY